MRIQSILPIFLCALSINACGKWAKAKKEAVNTVDIPTYPIIPEDVFSLSGGRESTNYRGTFLVFNNAAKADKIADIINASIALREAYAEVRKFEVETDYIATFENKASGRAANKLRLMQEGLAGFERVALEKSPLPAEKVRLNATTWFQAEINGSSLSDAEKALAFSSWEGYCEAKVIELAFHVSVATDTFKSLPSPMPMCKEYYDSKQYFTGPTCDIATNKGDFVPCLIGEGVLKTRWYAPLAATQGAAAASVTARQKKRDVLVTLLSPTNYVEFRNALGYVASAYGATTSSGKFRDGRVGIGKMAMSQTIQLGCKGFFSNVKVKDMCDFVFAASKETLAPKDYLPSFEGPTFDVKPGLFDSASLPSSRNGITTQQILRFLASRPDAENSEFDRILFEPNGNGISSPTYIGDPMFKELLSVIRSEVALQFYSQLSEADLIGRDERLAEIEALKLEIETVRSQYQTLSDATTAATIRGTEAANVGDSFLAFLKYEMVMDRTPSGLLRAEFKFGSGNQAVFRGCYDLTVRAAADCPEDFLLKGNITPRPAVIKGAEQGSKMDFSVTLDDPEFIGLGVKARSIASPDFFQDLPAEAYAGKTLHFELYRNRLLGHLDIMTGKAFIEDQGKVSYEAGISMWEQAGD